MLETTEPSFCPSGPKTEIHSNGPCCGDFDHKHLGNRWGQDRMLPFLQWLGGYSVRIDLQKHLINAPSFVVSLQLYKTACLLEGESLAP